MFWHPSTPWHVFVPALLGALTTGFQYAFSTYSGAVQTAFNFNQDELDTLGVVQILVQFLWCTCGIIMDRTSISLCCVGGGLVMALAWATYGAVALKHIPVVSPLPVLCGLGAVAMYSCGFFVAGVFTVITKNFREERTIAVSVAKSWVGISSGVGTAIFVGLFPSPDSDWRRLRFLYFLAVVSGLAALCAAPSSGRWAHRVLQ